MNAKIAVATIISPHRRARASGGDRIEKCKRKSHDSRCDSWQEPRERLSVDIYIPPTIIVNLTGRNSSQATRGVSYGVLPLSGL